jgi:2-polyprenyl-6-methoxyphenol hydroxylase-like FAD-dependent oxidoreductase
MESNEPEPTEDLPILIIGAGITGLILAQALRFHRIPYEIYERDPSQDSRTSHGWGLTIHWALPTLQSLLPPSLFARLREAEVDPQQSGERDTGRFQFLDLSTARPRYVIRPARRLRVNRRVLRERLLEGVEVRWGKGLVGFRVLGSDGEGEGERKNGTGDGNYEGGVEVRFSDGTMTRGRLLVGADGAGSRTRQILCPGTGSCYRLPVRFMGCTVRLSTEEMRPLKEIDPLLFQGSEPETGVFMWFSVLSTPETNGSGECGSRGGDGEGGEEREKERENENKKESGKEKEYFEGQVGLSWIVKTQADEVPGTNEERLGKFKDMAAPFEGRLRKAITDIPQGTMVSEVKIQDWEVVDWENHNGQVTLIGDAAHAMTMCTPPLYSPLQFIYAIKQELTHCIQQTAVKESTMALRT